MSAATQDLELYPDHDAMPVTELRADPFAEEAPPMQMAREKCKGLHISGSADFQRQRSKSLPWRLAEFLAREQLRDLEYERAHLGEGLARIRQALRAERDELDRIIVRARESQPHE